ncbi:conserved hypothetical protein [Mesorhizobium plurifarium]|uniref:Glyoxalase-like domain-containing protein n=1 Tax=Mesorhizobium plurifarium TaxID=69974 RepID=A0A0K2W7Y0_MESPL|nr:conserved hypothetical protein [Mesorhizobium plurifarium]
MKLDHIVWASNSLDSAAAQFAELSGVVAGAGGSHPGIGSRNALANLENDIYLAIDGPDPRQALEGNYGAFLNGLPSPVLWRFAVQTPDLDAARAMLARRGYETGVKHGGRNGAGGERLEWDTLSVADHDLGAGLPIIKSWHTSAHPSASAPSGCRLLELTVFHPAAAELRSLYADLGLDLKVAEAAEPALKVILEGRKGKFSLSS